MSGAGRRTLYLLRHAKSSWADPGLDDFDRPLSPRGRRACRALTAHFHREGVRPDLILSSASARTRETYAGLGDALTGIPTSFEERLYGANARRLLHRLQAVPSERASVLLIGHNPGIEELALQLAGPESHRRDLERIRRKFPTGALVTLDVPAPGWSDLIPGSARLLGFVRPTDLSPGGDINGGEGQSS